MCHRLNDWWHLPTPTQPHPGCGHVNFRWMSHRLHDRWQLPTPAQPHPRWGQITSRIQITFTIIYTFTSWIFPTPTTFAEKSPPERKSRLHFYHVEFTKTQTVCAGRRTKRLPETTRGFGNMKTWCCKGCQDWGWGLSSGPQAGHCSWVQDLHAAGHEERQSIGWILAKLLLETNSFGSFWVAVFFLGISMACPLPCGIAKIEFRGCSFR